jgi:predicted dehydrogenase
MKRLKKMKFGIIGLGFVSQIAHLPEIKKNKNIKLVAAAEKNPQLLKKVGKKFSIGKLYKSYQRMIKKESLDGVVISVQRKNTYSVVKDVIKKKIPVLSEKPAALYFKEAKDLAQLSSKNKSTYLIGYMKIHDEGVNFVKSFMNKKVLGNLKSVYYRNFSGESYFGDDNYYKQSKNYIKKHSLNKLGLTRKNFYIKFLNSNCHSINLLRYFFSKLKLSFNGLNKEGEGILYFRNNKTKIILNTSYNKIKKNWIEEIEFNFSNGILKLKLPPPLVKSKFSSISIFNFLSNKKKIINLKKNRSFKNQINFFLNQIKKKNTRHHCYGKNCLEDIKIVKEIF